MKNIDDAILVYDKTICKNIDKFDDSERGLLSQNIIAQLRHLVEHISLKVLSSSGNGNIEINYDNIKRANAYVTQRGDLKFLNKFHNLLQKSASHYNLGEENSERLMLKYYEYLIKIKSFLKKTYNLDVLQNIHSFPIDNDSTTKEYYEKIANRITQHKAESPSSDRYYIKKIKPFFVDYEVYYEVTFVRANDYVSKFDRIIAFTKFDISDYYAAKFDLSKDSINILGKSMPIYIISNWEVSIRPCEIKNFAHILGMEIQVSSSNLEYKSLMAFLTRTGLSLVEFIDSQDGLYEKIKNVITKQSNATYIFNLLDKSKEIVRKKLPGHNILRYLLYKLNNKIIKQQHGGQCSKLSNLNLAWGCIPFEQIPFNTALIGHNPKLVDLLDCLDSTNKEYELFAKLVNNNTEIKGLLYTDKEKVKGFENIDSLIKTYNKKIYLPKHENRLLEVYKNNVYIKGYEENILKIIRKLQTLSSSGIKDYSNSVEFWLKESSYVIDCDDKRTSLRQIFDKSRVVFIYGSAGTGKSTMINHISHFFNDYRKLYLANTNPAVDNLKRKVSASNCSFKTIAKFLSDYNDNTECDLLIIDECSTVSNSDMFSILEKASFSLLVLVGDVFQIESIRFGNWFDISRNFIAEESIFELKKPYRSSNEKLLILWDKVRNWDKVKNKDDDALEHIVTNNYSTKLDATIFNRFEDDEIILCLNYDGLYGINNINKFLQSINKSAPVSWGNLTYKVNDPILFNETKRFGASIYNNLKGKIVDIHILENDIQFDVEIDKVINEFDANGYDFELIDNNDGVNSIIRFCVSKYKSTDEDNESSDEIVPFQVAYAVSIHKAQGLEYNSVKVVITNEVEEMITHDIFYTAITRAKEKLQIYWSPEIENKILENLEVRNNKRDSSLLSQKFGVNLSSEV